MQNNFFLRFDKIPTATSQQKGEMVRHGRIIHYKKKNVIQAENDLEFLLRERIKHQPLDQEIHLYIEWRFPTKDKKKYLQGKTSRPDLDNMAKLLIDCMTRTGYFKDDSYITDLHLNKQWVQDGLGGIYIYYETKDTE